MSTYTVMRGWRDGESMQQHQIGPDQMDLNDAIAHRDKHGGYIVRIEDNAIMAPDGTWITRTQKKRGPGRPMVEEEPQKRRNISLADVHAEKARLIGEGNISEGIRRALDAYQA